MVRKLLIIVFCTILTSCYSFNKFGALRPIVHSKKVRPVDKKTFTLIDTSLVYKRVSYFSIDEKKYIERESGFYIDDFLKFYSNGKFGSFYNINLNDQRSVNPKRAQPGYYSIKNDTLVLKNLHWSIQAGGYWVITTLKYSKNDTLIISDGFYISKYVGIKLPKEFLKAQPDW